MERATGGDEKLALLAALELETRNSLSALDSVFDLELDKRELEGKLSRMSSASAVTLSKCDALKREISLIEERRQLRESVIGFALVESLSERSRATSQLEAAMSAIDAGLRTISALEQKIEEVSKTNVALSEEIDRLTKSRSWRITKPIRVISRLFR